MLKFLGGVIVTLLLLIGAFVFFREPIFNAAGVPKVVPLSVVVDKAKPAEKTVYGEADPVVHIGGSEPKFFGLIQSQRLLIATGHCTAGINFDKYAPKYLPTQDGGVIIRIVEPEIFGCGITEQRFYDSGGIPATQDLSNALAAQVNGMFAEAAVKSGILKAAKESAATKLELRLRQTADSFGTKVPNITVEFVKP